MSYYFIYPFAYLIGLLPYKVQFLFSDVLRFLLYRVVRYRRKVVRENLKKAFPEKSRKEVREIERSFYKHLADVFVETMSLASVSREQIMKRFSYRNIDQVEEWTAGKSWISAMGHYGSWEYTINWALYGPEDETLAVYKPLHNKGLDRYYRKVRKRFGVTPVPMKEVGREYIKQRRNNNRVVIALIADQSPRWKDIQPQHWTLFFGRKTAFFGGMEKMALKFGMPVLLMKIDKVKRGYYESEFELIYDGVEKIEEGEIVRRYAEGLEEMIRNRPELWMWSHKRWKHDPELWERQQEEKHEKSGEKSS